MPSIWLASVKKPLTFGNAPPHERVLKERYHKPCAPVTCDRHAPLEAQSFDFKLVSPQPLSMFCELVPG